MQRNFHFQDVNFSMANALLDGGVKLNLGEDSNQSQSGGNLVITESDHRVAMSMLNYDKSIVIDMIKHRFLNLKKHLKNWVPR